MQNLKVFAKILFFSWLGGAIPKCGVGSTFGKNHLFFRRFFTLSGISFLPEFLRAPEPPEINTTYPQLSIACRDNTRLPVTKKLQRFEVGEKIPKMTQNRARVFAHHNGKSPKSIEIQDLLQKVKILIKKYSNSAHSAPMKLILYQDDQDTFTRVCESLSPIRPFHLHFL